MRNFGDWFAHPEPRAKTAPEAPTIPQASPIERGWREVLARVRRGAGETDFGMSSEAIREAINIHLDAVWDELEALEKQS